MSTNNQEKKPWINCPECNGVDGHKRECSWWDRSRYHKDTWTPRPKDREETK